MIKVVKNKVYSKKQLSDFNFSKAKRPDMQKIEMDRLKRYLDNRRHNPEPLDYFIEWYFIFSNLTIVYLALQFTWWLLLFIPLQYIIATIIVVHNFNKK